MFTMEMKYRLVVCEN